MKVVFETCRDRQSKLISMASVNSFLNDTQKYSQSKSNKTHTHTHTNTNTDTTKLNQNFHIFEIFEIFDIFDIHIFF